MNQNYLILVQTPEVRKLPFYGHAVALIKGKWPHPHNIGDAPPADAGVELRELERAIEHRAQLEQELAKAIAVVRMLEADLAAIDGVWWSEPRAAHKAGKA